MIIREGAAMEEKDYTELIVHFSLAVPEINP